MAGPWYVDSGATGGTYDGTTEATAWLSVEDIAGTAAGETVYIAHDHAEDKAGSIVVPALNGTSDSPVNLISYNFSTNAYAAATGNCINTTDSANAISMLQNVYCRGLKFDNQTGPGGNILCYPAGSRQIVEDCIFNAGDKVIIGLASANQYQEYINCTFDILRVMLYQCTRGYFHFKNCTFTSFSSAGLFEPSSYLLNSTILLEDCVLTEQAKIFDNAAILDGSTIILRRCQVYDSAYDLVDGTFTLETITFPTTARMESCGSGTASKRPLDHTHYESTLGTISADLTRYLTTGGANDGVQANAYSLHMETTALANWIRPLKSQPITRWLEAGAQTIEVYVAGDDDLTADEAWIEVTSQNEATSFTGQCNTTREGPVASGTALTAGSAFTGSNVTYLHKFTQAITPAWEGPCIVQVCLAKPSVSYFFVDPQIQVA